MPKVATIDEAPASMAPCLDALSTQHKLLVLEYMKDFNKTQAAIRAGYAKNSAHVTGCKLLKMPKIAAAVQEQLKDAHMGADEALALLGEQARGDLGNYFDVSADGRDFVLDLLDEKGNRKPTRPLKKIKTKTTRTIRKDGEEETVETTLELHNSQKAIDMVLRAHGAYARGEQQAIYDSRIGRITSGSTAMFSIPAHLIGKGFLELHRDIHNRQHTEYVLHGGRGSLKSTFVGEEVPALLINNPQMHALVTRQVGNTLRDSVFNQIRWAITEMGLDSKFRSTVSPLEITYIPTGQKIFFRGGDDPLKIKSIKPPFGYIGILWFEELDQFRGGEAVRNIEQSAIRGGDLAYIFKSFNAPMTASNWANRYIKIPKATQFVHFSNYRDVPPEWLGKVFLAEAAHLKLVNPMAYEHEYGGIATGTGGLIFPNLKIQTITDTRISKFDTVLRGIDWGYFPHPFAYGKYHYDAKRMILYIYDEYWTKREGNKATYKHLVEHHDLQYRDEIIADPAEPKSIGDYLDYGANIQGASRGPGSLAYSMKWLQSLNAIVVDEKRAPKHAWEMLKYELEKDKNGEFISGYPREDDDCIAATRYGTNPIWVRRGQ